jgi:hypothetical protein
MRVNSPGFNIALAGLHFLVKIERPLEVFHCAVIWKRGDYLLQLLFY